jgi:hypothetical protein
MMLLSSDVMESMLEHHSRWLVRFPVALKATGAEVFVISAPPPHRRHPALADGETGGVRTYVATLYRNFVMAKLKAAGIEVITPPEIVFDDNGLMRVEYASSDIQDPHHANLEYGMLMLARVFQHVRSRNYLAYSGAVDDQVGPRRWGGRFQP